MKPRAPSVKIARADAGAFLCAAHAMTARAWVVVDKSGSSWTAWLSPRPGAPKADLAAAFRAAYALELQRAKLMRAGLPLRAERLKRLLSLDSFSKMEGEGTVLSDERKAEIAALLAEDGQMGPGFHDPRGIRKNWEDLK